MQLIPNKQNLLEWKVKLVSDPSPLHNPGECSQDRLKKHNIREKKVTSNCV